MRLIDKFDYLRGVTVDEVSGYILKADKDLFMKLKDGVYTLD
jgi:hypothetical protein